MRRECIPYFFFLFFTGVPTGWLQAQQYSYAAYSVRNGLASSTVYAIVQDKTGFIWFGTETGLSRFDGSRFVNFHTTDGLPDNEIIKLFVDSRNRIWIVPFKNSLCYYLHDRIHNQENDPLLRRLHIISEVISVIEDAKGDLIVAETKAIHIIHPDGRIVDITSFENKTFFVVQAGLNSNGECRFVLADVGTGNILADLHNDTLHIYAIQRIRPPNSYFSTRISPQLEIHQEEDSLFFLNTRDNTSFSMLAPKGFINISQIDDSDITINGYAVTLLLNIRRKKIVDSFLTGHTVDDVL